MTYCDSVHPYEILTDNLGLPVSIEDLKRATLLNHLLTCQDEDEFLKQLVRASVLCFEQISRRILMKKTLRTYANCWFGRFNVRRSPLVSVEAIKYTDTDDNEQTVSSGDYYIYKDAFYSTIMMKNSFVSPSLVSDRLQAITIDVIVGYASDETDTPADIKLAIYQHVLAMYENRGACLANPTYYLPAASRAIFNHYKIERI